MNASLKFQQLAQPADSDTARVETTTRLRSITERVEVAPPPRGMPNELGWQVCPFNEPARHPLVRFVARAQFGKKSVQRLFRDFASAKAWADMQNARLIELEPERAEPLLTSKELARKIGGKATYNTIVTLRQRGLPFIKISSQDYRYRWSEVTAFLESERVEMRLPEKPFLLEPYSKAPYSFRVRGTGGETKLFVSEKKAKAYLDMRNNRAGLEPVAPLPRHVRGMDPDGPFCQVRPYSDVNRPDLRYEAVVYFEGRERPAIKRFTNDKEAQRYAANQNLQFERDRVAREVAAAPTPEVVAKGQLGSIPPISWTPGQFAGIDSGHHCNDPMKGPPFRIATTSQAGYSYVVYGISRGKGPRSRSFFKTEREAKTYAHMKNTEAQSQGLESLVFPSWLRTMAQRCQQQLASRNKSIEDATRFYLEYLERTEKSIELGAMIKLCMKAKRGAGFSKAWISALTAGLRKFQEFIGEHTVMSEIGSPRIMEFIANIPGSPASRNSMRMVLWALFSYAEKTGYVSQNPVRATTKEKEIAAPVGILTVAQLSRLLEAAPEPWLPFLAIGAFAGLRTAELTRLDWSHVDLVDGYVEVLAENAKSARRRLIKIVPALDAYIRPYAKPFGRVCPCAGFIPSGHIPEALKQAGIGHWPKNALRHSFASYHIAHFQNTPALALDMGHITNDLIFNHYRQVVRQAEAAAYWELRPPAVDGAEKVVPMVAG